MASGGGDWGSFLNSSAGGGSGNGTTLPICQYGAASNEAQLCSTFVTAMCEAGVWTCAGAIAAVALADIVDAIIGEGRPKMAATKQIAAYAKDNNPILRVLGWGATVLLARNIPVSSSSGEAGSFGPYFTTAVFLKLTYDRNATASGAANFCKSLLHEMGNNPGGTISDARAIVAHPETIKKGTTDDKKRSFTLGQLSKITQILADSCSLMIGPNSIAGFTCPSPPPQPATGGGTPAAVCPAGQTFDVASQACQPSPVAGVCPAGWVYNPNTNSCTPQAYAGGGSVGGGGSYTDQSSPYTSSGSGGQSSATGQGATVASLPPAAVAPSQPYPYAPLSFSVGPDTVTYPGIQFGGPGPFISGPDIGPSYSTPLSFAPINPSDAMSYYAVSPPTARFQFQPPDPFAMGVTKTVPKNIFSQFPWLRSWVAGIGGAAEAIVGLDNILMGKPVTQGQWASMAGAIIGGLLGIVGGPAGVAAGVFGGLEAGAEAGLIVDQLEKASERYFGQTLDDLLAQPAQSALNLLRRLLPKAKSDQQPDTGQNGNGASPQDIHPTLQGGISHDNSSTTGGYQGGGVNCYDPRTKSFGPCGQNSPNPSGSTPQFHGQPSQARPTPPPSPQPSGATCTPCEEIKKALQACDNCEPGGIPLEIRQGCEGPDCDQHTGQCVGPNCTPTPPALHIKPQQNPITVCYTCESDSDLAAALSGQPNHCSLVSTSGGSAEAAATAMHGATNIG